MSDGAIHEMSRAVGALQSDVRGMKESLENLNRVWGERERDATQGRSVIHGKLDGVRVDMARLTAEVENLSTDVNEIKPAIAEFKGARQRQLGAQRMGKMIWVAFIGIAGVAGGAIVHFFRG